MIFCAVYRVLEKEDAIRFEMRACGSPVVVEVMPSLLVMVRHPSSERILAVGEWNLTNVVWSSAYEELCVTALDMVDAQVLQVVLMFRRRVLSASWLEQRARMEIGV